MVNFSYEVRTVNRITEQIETPLIDTYDTVVVGGGVAGVAAALAALPEMYRIPLVLYHQQGLSYQEIADNLGRHVKSIDNALQRIKKKIDKTQIIRYNKICIRLSYSIMDACIVGFLEVLEGNSFKE